MYDDFLNTVILAVASVRTSHLAVIIKVDELFCVTAMDGLAGRSDSQTLFHALDCRERRIINKLLVKLLVFKTKGRKFR